MRTRLLFSSGLVVGVASLLTGCNSAGGGGLLGAGAGAAGGAAIGSLFGQAGTGAVIGAVGGGLSGAVIGDQNGRAENGGQDPGWFGEKKGNYAAAPQGHGGGSMVYHTQTSEDAVWNPQTQRWEVTNANRRITGTGTSTGPTPDPVPQR